jgi:hypothetical protein
MGSQGPSKHREGKADRDKQGSEKTEGVPVPKRLEECSLPLARTQGMT